MDEAKNQIIDWEHKEAKNNQSKQLKKELKKNEDSVSSLWDNFKCSNIHIVGVPEGREKEQEIRNLFEKIMKGNFPNLVKEIGKSRKHRESQTRWCKEAHSKKHRN